MLKQYSLNNSSSKSGSDDDAAELSSDLAQHSMLNEIQLNHETFLKESNPTLIEDSYPLSPMQQGMLFHSLYDEQSGVDIEQIVCNLHEKLDVEMLVQAWKKLSERHPILRTSFNWHSPNGPTQQVCHDVPLSFTQYDWRALDREEQISHCNTYLRLDRQQGFDLSQAPLMRLTLFQLTEAEYQLVWTFHHILLDGRSFPLLLKEVFDLYEAFCQGQDLQIASPRSYRDYITWLKQKDNSKAKGFWQQLLKDFSTPTPLLSAQVSNNLVERENGEEELFLSPTLTTALQTFAKCHGLTPNTILQGAWAILLSRYSGEQDVVFGTLRACRHSDLTGVESMIGLLINTVPVRVQVSADASLIPWLQDLRSQHIAVRPYEHTPLIDVQSWSEVPSGTPMFESLVAFENYQLNTKLQQQGGKWQNRQFQLYEKLTFPLALLGCLDTELALKISYDLRRFEQATIARMLGHLQTLLEGMIANPEKSLKDLEILTTAEKHQLLVEWNDTTADYSQQVCLHQLFEAQVKRNPDAIAIVFEHQHLTYGELNRQANQLAHHLKTLGVGPDTFVSVYMNRGLEMIPALLGILKAGGAYIPLEPTFPNARVEWILDSLDVRLVITQPLHQSTFEELHPQLPNLEHLICLDLAAVQQPVEQSLPPVLLKVWHQRDLTQQPDHDLPQQSSPDDTAYIIFTSGSTGTPKGVVVRHKPAINLIEWVNRTFNVNERDRVLFITSLCFDLSVYDVFGLLAAGGSIRIVSSDDVRDPSVLLNILCSEPITFWDSAPPALQQLTPFFSTIQGEDIRNQLRLVFMSGDWVPVTLPDVLKETFPGIQVVSLGGATEATVWSNFYQIGKVESNWASIPYGKPIQNAQYYVLDSYLNPCPIGVTGELYIGGDCLASGYTDPAKTAERFIPDPFRQSPEARLYRTGDLARFFPDGNIEFLGRIDHQVKIRGFRVELGEIEAVLSQHASIRVSMVMAREDQPGEKYLVAYVVPHEDQLLTTSEMRSFLREKLPEYMVPSAFILLDGLPLTANGKVDRRALPAPEMGGGDRGAAFVAPRNELEHQLVEIWEEVLNVKPIGIQDNFFELGGHSLSAVRMWNLIGKKFGKALPLSRLLSAPTIEQFAAILAPEKQLQEDKPEASTIARHDCLVLLKTGGSKPPIFFIHDGDGEILLYRGLAHCLDPEVPAYGIQPYGDDQCPILHTRISDIVTYYIEKIRKVQPEGPYFLAGLCVGGLIAFEIAEQLQQQGQVVKMVALLDSVNVNGTQPTDYITSQRLTNFAMALKGNEQLKRYEQLFSILNRSGKKIRNLVAHESQKTIGSIRDRLRLTYFRHCIDRGLSIPAVLHQIPVRTILMWAQYEKTPQTVFEGKVILFRATQASSDFNEADIDDTPLRDMFIDPLLGWGDRASAGIAVHDIPGGHSTMLQEPNVRGIAKIVQTYIDTEVSSHPNFHLAVKIT